MFDSNANLFLSKKIIKTIGVDCAVIIALFTDKATKSNSHWFTLTYDDITNEVGLSKYIASNAIKKLIEIEILIEKKEGIPFKRFFRIQEDKLFDFLK